MLLSTYRILSGSLFPSLLSFLASFLVVFPDRYGLIHQARISASVNAMRVLNTGTEVEAAVADALVSFLLLPDQKPVSFLQR